MGFFVHQPPLSIAHAHLPLFLFICRSNLDFHPMKQLKQRGQLLFLSLLLLLTSAKTNAQNKDSIQQERISAFFSGYNSLDYDLMRQQLGGPTKLILTKGLLKKLFKPQMEMNGPVVDQYVSRTTVKNTQMRIRYARDSTEWQPFGFAFNNKNKIIGLQTVSANFRFPAADSMATHRSREDRIAAIDSSFQLKLKAGVFEGCILVADEQGLLYRNCSGSMTEHTVFELASVSKQFTAVATLQLVAQGKLKLDREVAAYFPEFPYAGVTVRMLLNHSSGLPDYMDLIEKHWDKKRIATNADMLALLVKHHPKKDFKPGKKHEYSNTGYALLACLIEKVSGRTYAEQLKVGIFEPAGMVNSRVYHRRLAGQIPANLAVGRVWSDSLQRFAVPDSLPDYNYLYYMDGIAGDGCVNSTLADLQLWQKALKTGILLPDSLLQQAWQPTTFANGVKENYGFGWVTERDENKIPLLHHSGSWPGYIAFMLFPYDQEGLVVVVSNNNYNHAVTYGRNLTAWLLDRR